jgi:hypothetical protein
MQRVSSSIACLAAQNAAIQGTWLTSSSADYVNQHDLVLAALQAPAMVFPDSQS